MKQKILSVLLFSAMILSMAGCGGTQSTEPNENESETFQENEVTTSTVSETTTAEQEQTESETTTTELVEEEPPREIQNITDYESFENGTFHFISNKTGYVYDILENKMYSYDPSELKNNDTTCGKLIADDETITNLETMENYDVKAFYDNDAFGGIYNPVYSVKEDFDGNVYSFGILGSNGEWILPMSSEYSVCELLKTDEYLREYVSKPAFATSSFVVFSTVFNQYVYNYKTDEIIEIDNEGPNYCGFVDNYIILYNYVDYGGWGYMYEYNRIYNTNTKDTTEIVGNYTALTECNNCVLLTSENDYLILDSKGNVLDYDLSKYNKVKIINATEDYIVFNATNTDGDEYTIILDKNGNRVIDPIKGSRSSDYMYIYGDYIVYTVSDKNFIVNCKTGEIKNDIYIEKFDPDSGKLLIKSDGNYYLADVSDPDTLINPFEVAEMK